MGKRLSTWSLDYVPEENRTIPQYKLHWMDKELLRFQIPRTNSKATNSTPATLNATTTYSLHRPHSRSDGTQTSVVRRSHIAECEARLFERNAHVEALRERVRRFLQQAAFLRNGRRGNNTLLQDSRSVGESRDEPIPDVFSHMVENSEVDLQNALHDVLSDVKKSLKEDVNEQMIISHEYNEQKLGELTHRFEQLLRQQEYAHQQEVLELQGSIEYLQEKLVTDREQREALEQELEDANMKLLERSEEMGSIRAELSDLRKEVQELREYKAKHKREMQNVEKLRKELEAYQAVHRITREEFAKIEDERDELREEFEKSLQRIKLANQRRNRTIEEELDETMDELLS